MLVIIAVVWWLNTSDSTNQAVNTPVAPLSQSIVIPQLSPLAQLGETAFNENCAACHGKNATGSDQGPPLIHKFYSSKRHADFAFVIAAKSGVRAHHWRFGSMPPIEGITDEEIAAIVKYVREIQTANGI